MGVHERSFQLYAITNKNGGWIELRGGDNTGQIWVSTIDAKAFERLATSEKMRPLWANLTNALLSKIVKGEASLV